jgi:hypothetical protein
MPIISSIAFGSFEGDAEVFQYAYPDADNVATGWTATPLYQKVDEPTTPSDADYITATAT